MPMISLTAADGFRLQAYRTGPQDAARALVVTQEIFGVNHHIRKLCDNFAAAGYAVIAPQLFDRAERNVELGYDAADLARGRELRGKIDAGKTVLDILAAAAALPGLEAPMEPTGALPVDVLQTLFASLDPFGIAEKFRGFAKLAQAFQVICWPFGAGSNQRWTNRGRPIRSRAIGPLVIRPIPAISEAKIHHPRRNWALPAANQRIA